MRTLTKALSFSALTVALAAPPLGVALANEPAKTVTVKATRPNLDAAQKLASQAIDTLETAEKANEYDTEGHAQKARELLKTANDEIKLAAEAAKTNANPRKTK